KQLRERGLRIAHVDAVIVAEKPKLNPYFPRMSNAIAKALGIQASQVNLKAKTHEGVGEIGRGEAIAAHAIATLEG
ncbi:MAG TPA: 2-C-methyl-D-erythritol 2,4-cyclodiphosphate synthase, partial [Candidatus Acidoferrales bacterium]|nr:2-C-methyl-D-erythritol 2,4-cyclodiphosphate synthase [Candidatus Acidoferrales bacterium]